MMESQAQTSTPEIDKLLPALRRRTLDNLENHPELATMTVDQIIDYWKKIDHQSDLDERALENSHFSDPRDRKARDKQLSRGW